MSDGPSSFASNAAESAFAVDVSATSWRTPAASGWLVGEVDLLHAEVVNKAKTRIRERMLCRSFTQRALQGVPLYRVRATSSTQSKTYARGLPKAGLDALLVIDLAGAISNQGKDKE
jgi:hypothetical protein